MSDFDSKARSWDADPSKWERARRVAEAIIAQVPPRSHGNALEYGCGTGLLGFFLQPHVHHLTLADTSREMLAVLREKIAAAGVENMTPLELDLSTGPLPDARYDLVCTLLTLHHIPDTDAILRRFHALLAAGGYLCLSDLDAEDGSFHGPGFAGHNGFDRADLAQRLARLGFRNIRSSTAAEIEKQTQAGVRRFPVFLMIAEKS